MRKVNSGLLALGLVFIPVLSFAADRPQNISIDDYSMRPAQYSESVYEKEDLALTLRPGSVLGYDTYRNSRVIKRDPLTGNISLDVSGHKVQIRPDTREILDFGE